MNTLKSILIIVLSSISILTTAGCSSYIEAQTSKLNNSKSDILTHNMAYEVAYKKSLQMYHTENIYSNGTTSDGNYSFIINTDTYTMYAYVNRLDGSIYFDNPIIYINNIGQDQAKKFANNYLSNYYKSDYKLSLDSNRMTEVSDWKFIAKNSSEDKIFLSVDCYGIVSEE